MKDTKELVQEWQEKHPDGTRKECEKDLGVSYTTVWKYWTSTPSNSLSPKAKLVRNWQQKHPTGTLTQCAAELQTNYANVAYYWKSPNVNRMNGAVVWKIYKWRQSNPNGNRKECATDTGISYAVVTRYWNETPNDKTPTETLRERVQKWRAEHPEGTQKECAKSIGAGCSTVSNYWNKKIKDGHITPAQKTVQNWQKEHPDGNKTECMIDTGLSHTTVRMFWKSTSDNTQHNGGDDSKNDGKAKELVEKWQHEHPGGTKLECAGDLGISYSLVVGYWIPTKEQINKKPLFQLVYEWQQVHPLGTRKECIKDLGISNSTVQRNWTPTPFKPLPKKGKQTTGKTKELVSKWQQEHPDGMQKECASDLGFCRYTVLKYWTKPAGNAELIKKWQEDHPAGTRKECAEDLGVSYATASNYWTPTPLNSGKPSSENAELVREWQREHPDGMQKECAEDLGVCRNTVSKCWVKPVGNAELVKKWQQEHPAGTRKECASDLGVSYKTVWRHWAKEPKKDELLTQIKSDAKTTTRICKACGKTFEPEKQWRYLCPDCAKEARTNGAKRTHTCVICGAQFVSSPRAKYCPACRDGVARERAKKYRQKGPNRKIGSKDICEACGEEYIVTSGAQKYCKKCAEEAMAANDRKAALEYFEKHKEHLAEYKKQAYRHDKKCVVCGKMFYSGNASITCSPECSAAYYKQLRKKYEDARKGEKRYKKKPEDLRSVLRNGEKVQQSYIETCKDLGFDYKLNFVWISAYGTIGAKGGSDDDIKALYKACLEKGYRPTKPLEQAAIE